MIHLYRVVLGIISFILMILICFGIGKIVYHFKYLNIVSRTEDYVILGGIFLIFIFAIFYMLYGIGWLITEIFFKK
jgi:hypothetical protein